MSSHHRGSHPIDNLLPTESEGFDALAELALDLRWAWNHATDEVWRQLDAVLWEYTKNPWAVLQTVSRAKLQRLLANPAFRKQVDDLLLIRHQKGSGTCLVSAAISAVSLEMCRVFQYGIHAE